MNIHTPLENVDEHVDVHPDVHVDVHLNEQNVDVLDDIDNRLIEQTFYAKFGPDADISDLIVIIETFSERNRPKRVQCKTRYVQFRVNLPG